MRVKRDNKLLVIGLVVVIILGIITYIIVKNSNKETDYSGMTEEEVAVAVQEKIDKMERNELGEMGERDRMEHYVASFATAIENKKYEEAYEMLYDDFKKNYFPTLASFEEYAQNKFPSMIALEHTNIERNGSVYILWTEMYNPLSASDSAVEMNFVIQENDLNDFDLSFSVI